jgi:D-tyrosyl-tRNA(Tyr) deacylase
VTSASVTVDKNLIASIGKGILVLAAVGPDDTRADAESMASKVLKLKMWPDDNGGTVCLHRVIILAEMLMGFYL